MAQNKVDERLYSIENSLDIAIEEAEALKKEHPKTTEEINLLLTSLRIAQSARLKVANLIRVKE